MSQELPQEIESVLAEHLVDWDGNSNRVETFRLISYLKPPQLEGMLLRFTFASTPHSLNLDLSFLFAA
jgi:hypothetical protein